MLRTADHVPDVTDVQIHERHGGRDPNQELVETDSELNRIAAGLQSDKDLGADEFEARFRDFDDFGWVAYFPYIYGRLKVLIGGRDALGDVDGRHPHFLLDEFCDCDNRRGRFVSTRSLSRGFLSPSFQSQEKSYSSDSSLLPILIRAATATKRALRVRCYA